MNYWLAVGSKKNWDTAFEHGNIWGLEKTQRHLWENIKEDDRILFYATNPVGGIIRHGIIRTKFMQDKPLWPDELSSNKVIWPLRFEFDIEFCLPPDKWVKDKTASKELWPRAGFRLIGKGVAETLVSNLGVAKYASLKYELPMVAEEPAEFTTVSPKQVKAPLSHDDLQNKLIEIGKLQNFIAEKEIRSTLENWMLYGDVLLTPCQHTYLKYKLEEIFTML